MKLTAKHLVLVLAAGVVILGVTTHLQNSASSAVAAPVQRLSAADLCRRDLAKLVNFRDPGSMQISDVEQEPKPAADGRTAVSLTVNAKNGFGGFTGAQGYVCEADEAAQRAVYAAPMHP